MMKRSEIPITPTHSFKVFVISKPPFIKWLTTRERKYDSPGKYELIKMPKIRNFRPKRDFLVLVKMSGFS